MKIVGVILVGGFLLLLFSPLLLIIASIFVPLIVGFFAMLCPCLPLLIVIGLVGAIFVACGVTTAAGVSNLSKKK
jgi:hypothetical protein